MFPPILSKECNRVTNTLAPVIEHRLTRILQVYNIFDYYDFAVIPDAPIGCPKAIAPPFILTLFGFKPRVFTQAIACAAKASFNSYKSTSSFVHFAFCN